MEEVVRQSLQMNLQQKWTKSHHRGKAISSILLSLVGFHKDAGCYSEEMGVLAVNRLKGKGRMAAGKQVRRWWKGSASAVGAVGTGRGGWIPVSVQAKLIQTGKWMCHVGNGAKTGESAHKVRRQELATASRGSELAESCGQQKTSVMVSAAVSSLCGCTASPHCCRI